MAALTAAVTAALLAPLFRSRAQVTASETEVAIYRDQLNEIERDVERGVLPESEAKAARAEIARRLIHAGEGAEPAASEPPGRRRIIVWIAVIAVPLAGLGAYLALGTPNEVDYPYAERLTDPSTNDLFARLQTAQNRDSLAGLQGLVDDALAKTPDNARLLEAAALVYLGANRFEDAVNAYNQFIAIAGPDGDPDGAFAQMLGENIMIGEGGVTPLAAAMFNRVLSVDPSNPSVRLYLAIDLKARGENDAAVAAFLDLLQDEPAGGAPWGDLARAQLADLGVEAPPPPAAAPAASAPAASPAPAAFTPDQLEMINQMVAGLAARLAENPDDLDGWAQLIRSYIVLGRTEDAQTAVATAREVFAGNADALATIEAAAAQLGDTE